MPVIENVNADAAPENGQGPEDSKPRAGIPREVLSMMLSKLAGADIDQLKSRLANQVRDNLVGTICDAVQDELFDHLSVPLILGVCARMTAFNMARAAKPGHEAPLIELQITQMRKDYESACAFFAAQRAEEAADDAEKGDETATDDPAPLDEDTITRAENYEGDFRGAERDAKAAE